MAVIFMMTVVQSVWGGVRRREISLSTSHLLGSFSPNLCDLFNIIHRVLKDFHMWKCSERFLQPDLNSKLCLRATEEHIVLNIRDTNALTMTHPSAGGFSSLITELQPKQSAALSPAAINRAQPQIQTAHFHHLVIFLKQESVLQSSSNQSRFI